MNLLITKAKREKLLDEFANSSLPIDLFCEMHNVKQEVIKNIMKQDPLSGGVFLCKRPKIDAYLY